MLHFNNEEGVDRKDDQADVNPYPDEEETEDVR